MKNDEGLDFALSRKTGQMVDITMVERGLACNSVCPNCGVTLQARKGRKNRHHFAHHIAGKGADTCEGGRESALHAAARQSISSWRSIELPSLLVEEGGRQASLPGRSLSLLRSERPDDEGGTVYWGRGRVRPDVVLHAEAEQVWCEVMVTHPIGEPKRSRLRHHKVSTLEFDLSAIHRSGGWTLAMLDRALRSDSSILRWAFHPDEEPVRERLRAENLSAEALRRGMMELHRSGSMREESLSHPESDEQERIGLNLHDGGDLVFHTAMGLIPKDPVKRLAFVARAYPAPKVYRLARAIVFLRYHPHGDSTCLVTFGANGSASRTSDYDAKLSEFARSAGLSCAYFGITESRQIRGERCYLKLDQFLTTLQDTEAAIQPVPSDRVRPVLHAS